MTRHYYLADNSYGSESSWGFANTWYVVRCNSLAQRDAELSKRRRSLTARPIKAAEIRHYGGIAYAFDGEGHLCYFEIDRDASAWLPEGREVLWPVEV